MFKTLYIRELQNYLYSLRFQISFIISILVFVTGSISSITLNKDAKVNYEKYSRNETNEREALANNISKLATKKQVYTFPPRDNNIISESKESYLPNQITYNAYNVYGFDSGSYNNNPFLSREDSLNWEFIVSMFFSFITLLFAFDAISGEKEDKTLALVFSNPVPRGIFLASKFLSIISVTGIMLITGLLCSLLILMNSGKVLINISFWVDTFIFFINSILFITAFAAFGLLSSAITRHSNISLLTSLCFWLFTAMIIPNTSLFIAKKIFSIPTQDEIQQKVKMEGDDIYRNAPEGSTSASGGNPFYPQHELRANLYTKTMLSEKRIMDNYYIQMFRQFEKTRALTLFSPIAQFNYINEASVNGGYLRFHKNWNDLHIFQEQFLQWFKDIDAKDEKSPHWYNPYESFSTSIQPVNIDQIPIYQEQKSSFGKRILFISNYLIIMLITGVVLFGFCFFLFIRYDIR